jgi:hypothetical protein
MTVDRYVYRPALGIYNVECVCTAESYTATVQCSLNVTRPSENPSFKTGTISVLNTILCHTLNMLLNDI